ncbi:hypothetical protein ACFFLM_14250 [Deinococcus oregonensis]|uniref:DUF4307 domain-containing protein n=1 Tax=Deinococcus oregonensis TaxID=1805970 RepID=A0ABV6B0B4_9DEIO
MTGTKKPPAVSNTRAIWGYGAALALVALATGLYFAPRPIPESDVVMWCEREARKQSSNKIDFSVADFNQQGYTATFNINSLDGKTSVPASCSVGGSARDPQIAVEVKK